jgi:putative ABC transport system permease protein
VACMEMFENLKVSFFLASKSIQKGNTGTAILTVMIMSLIFVNLVFLPSMISGIGESMKQQSIDCAYGNLVIEPKEDNLYINNADSLQKKLNRLPGVAGTSARYVSGATFAHKSKFVSGPLHSINPVDEETVTIYHTGIIDGEYLSKSDTDEILLGIDITGREGVEDDEANLGGVKVGDKIDVTFSNGVIREYRVKGIFAVGARMDNYAFITEKEMESVLGLDDRSSEILVKLDQRGTEEEFKKKFIEIGISEDIKTWEEKTAGMIGSIISSFALINLISAAVGLIMAVVVIFIIIYINTVNNRKQIGILKAIGINQRIIIHSYVIQALFYCFSGIIAGSILLYFLTSYMTANPIKFPMGDVKPLVEQQLIITSIISLITVSLIAGSIPSWKTAKESILESIWG